MSSTVTTLLGFAALVVTLAINAGFVAVEFAMVAADRSRIALAAEQGSRRAEQLDEMFRRLTFHLSGAQIGVTITSILLGFLAEPLLGDALLGPVGSLVGARAAHTVAVVLALAIATVVQLIAAELVPKNVAVARPESTALLLAVPLRIFDATFSALIGGIDRTANRIVRAFGVEPVEELDDVPTLAELASLVRTSGAAGALGPDATRLLSRTIRFADRTAADALVPRMEMTALPLTATVADLAVAVASHGFSRYPVYGDDLDDIVGVVLARDVFGVPFGDRAAAPLAPFVTPAVVVPESQPLENTLPVLRRGGRQMAVVIDEYGGTAGILTLEDVLEELVGEIDDEYDQPELTPPTVVARGTRTFVLDAGLHVDDVAERCGLVMPEGPYETLAGFVLVQLDRVPARGDTFTWNGWRFEVVEMDRHRIVRVAVDAPDESNRPAGSARPDPRGGPYGADERRDDETGGAS